MFLLLKSFFGLQASDKIEYLWEDLFALVNYCKINLNEAYLMPVGFRRWFLHRFIQSQEENKVEEKNKPFKHPFFEKKK